MKKLLLAIVFSGCAIGMIAQPVSRKVLVEEATNASCPPCAAQNPAFNANIVQPNIANDKLVAVKYQAWWPGFDPMYNQNTTELDARITYYGFNNIGVPTTALNGRVPDNNNTTGGGWSGYAGGPYGYTQAVIDAEYADLTPFSMTMSHVFSNDLDSVYVTIGITNVDVTTFTGSTMKLQVALMENEIIYNTAPGTNGETDFYEVMRKMIPDASGTTLGNTWMAGQSQTITLGAAIPSYIFNYNEIAIAAWIQDDATQEVWQAEHSQPIPVNGEDMGIALNNGVSDYCQSSFTPEVTLTNDGANPITAATLGMSLNGSAPMIESWSGNLMPGSSATYTFTNSATLAGGANTLEIAILDVNGGVDINTTNNLVVDDAIISMPANALALDHDETFESAQLGGYPANVYVDEYDADAMWTVNQNVGAATWNLGGFENSAQSMRWRLFSFPAGGQGGFVYTYMDATEFDSVNLSFSLAYAQLDASATDRLEILASTDCGQSWSSVFDEQGSNLATAAPDGQNTFYPVAADWTTRDVNMDAYAGETVMLKFRATSNGGNCMYIDDINVSGDTTVPVVVDPPSDTTEVTIDGQVVYVIDGDTFELFDGEFVPLGVQEAANAAVVVFPNPAKDVLNITGVNGLANVKIYDMSGRLVMNQAVSSNVISVAELQAGVYQVSIESGDINVMRRVTVSR